MVEFYVNRIREGKLTLADVLPRWYEAVKQALENPDDPGKDDTETQQKAEAFDYLTGRGDQNE